MSAAAQHPPFLDVYRARICSIGYLTRRRDRTFHRTAFFRFDVQVAPDDFGWKRYSTSRTGRYGRSGKRVRKILGSNANRRHRTIQNKVGAFLADPMLYRSTNSERPIHIPRIMHEGKILLDLAKVQIGEDALSLCGGLLVTGIGLAAFSQQDTELAARRPVCCYLDEFQNFRRSRWPICSPSSGSTASA